MNAKSLILGLLLCAGMVLLAASCGREADPTGPLAPIAGKDAAVPVAPGDLTAGAEGGNIVLRWSPPEVIPGFDFAYYVYRSLEPTTGWENPPGGFPVQSEARLARTALELLTTEPVAGTSFVDATAPYGGTCYYRVRIVQIGPDGEHPKQKWTNEAKARRELPPLLVTSRRAGPYDLYAVDPSATVWIPLTSDAAEDGSAYWSPDGSKILFVRRETSGSNALVILDLRTMTLTHVTDLPNFSSVGGWCAGGERVVYTRFRTTCNSYGIFTNNLTGTDEQLLFAPSFGSLEDRDIYGVRLSADLQCLVWAGQNGCSSPTLEIYKTDLTPAGVTTSNQLTGDGKYDDVGFVAADGTILYWHAEAANGYAETSWEIYKMNCDGSGKTRLTNDGWSDSHPVASPESDLIIWSQADYLATPRTVDLWSMRMDGSEKTRLTDDGLSNVAWDWRR